MRSPEALDSGGPSHAALGAAGLRPMAREDFALETVELARTLIGCHLLYRGRLLRITETEAYRGGDDPASHAFGGRTRRNAPMFGPPGHLYVYFTYGMHNCVNVVGAADGEPSGVLLRAGELLRWDGDSECLVSDSDNSVLRSSAVGPGRLGRKVGATVADSGMDACSPGAAVRLFRDRSAVRPAVGVSTRIGVSGGEELEWRFFDSGSRLVSRHPGGS
ncbi:MAG: DNA-3-methyladenine glycosylase [Actinomycetota bacterium]|nr:DNA-3-methyladenine glycosylase [Actinomycetota bacterium]